MTSTEQHCRFCPVASHILESLMLQPYALATKILCLTTVVTANKLKDKWLFEEIVEDMRVDCRLRCYWTTLGTLKLDLVFCIRLVVQPTQPWATLDLWRWLHNKPRYTLSSANHVCVCGIRLGAIACRGSNT